MKNHKSDFDFIQETLKEGAFKLNNPDFDSCVMNKISLKKNYTKNIQRSIKRGVLCLCIGLLSCFSFIVLLLLSNEITMDQTSETISLISLFLLGVVGILLIDNFLKLLYNYKSINQ